MLFRTCVFLLCWLIYSFTLSVSLGLCERLTLAITLFLFIFVYCFRPYSACCSLVSMISTWK
jgi:uncharacterized membrane protein